MNPSKFLLAAIISILAVSQSLATTGDSVQLTDISVAFAYESRADIPTSTENLAKIISMEYRLAPDEFTARELFKKIEPVVVQKLDEAKKTKTWSVHIGDTLAQYDFKKEAFPTGLSKATFIPYDNYYAVRFSNAEKYEMLPVKVETARKLSEALQRGRACTMIVEGEILSTKEDKINRTTRKIADIKIKKLTVKLRDDTLVGTLDR